MLTMKGITKSFGAVQALKGVDFAVSGGEVVVLLGENGAGKSTLLKAITGVHSPDSGEIDWMGKVVTIDTPAKAQTLGIRMVYQELNLAPHLTVAANICLGNEPSRFGIMDRKAVRERAKHLIDSHHFALDPDALVGDLGPAQRQLVEICKALAGEAKLLLLDEPTSSLGEKEIADLFETLRRLKRQGIGIVYVSHRLPECFAIGDRIVVLRDGEKVYSAPIPETDTATVVRAMVGRDLASYYPRTTHGAGSVQLSVRNLNVLPRLMDITFQAHAGEVVGIAGLMGSGRTTLLSALAGLRKATGDVTAGSSALPLGQGPTKAIQRGVGLITEDRKRTGLALGRSVRENITIAALNKVSTGSILQHTRERAAAMTTVERMGIRTSSTETAVGTLSGGNQQKVVMGRWFFAETRILLLDEPTRGVDVGSKVEIYQRINEATDSGATVLMVSSELPELLGMSDRILVLFQGRLVADIPRDQATPERVLHFCLTGVDIS